METGRYDAYVRSLAMVYKTLLMDYIKQECGQNNVKGN